MGQEGAPARHSSPPDLSLDGWWAAERRTRGAGDVPVSTASSMRGSDRDRPKGKSRTVFTRLWALVKMASLAYTTWWVMSVIHAGTGEVICAYGAVSLFAGFGAHWRRRFFGPGQLLEPELYEEIGQWLYRLGAAAVLVGGAVYGLQVLMPSHHSPRAGRNNEPSVQSLLPSWLLPSTPKTTGTALPSGN